MTTGTGTTGGRPGRRDERSGGGAGRAPGCLAGLLLVGVGLVVAVFLLLPVLRAQAVSMARENPQAMRMPLIGDIVAEELGAALTTPAGTTSEPVVVRIEPGLSVAAIGRVVAEAGLVADPLVFTWQVIRGGLDTRLQSGTFTLDRTLTPAQVAERLAGPPDQLAPRVTLGLRPGLRLEQIVAYLLTVDALELDVREVQRLLTDPPRALTADFPFLADLPRDASLEGFLAGGTYEVETAISPEDLVRALLTEWGEQMGVDAAERAEAAGLTLREAITLASIVEREVKVDKERRKVAGVYRNRLDRDLNPTRIMNADPTVVYAVDTLALREKPLREWTRYLFWDTVGSALSGVVVPDDLASFQTYVNPGLPDGPIATPTRASFDAALDPDRAKKLLYFYACPGSDTHEFARTLAEHTANIASCS
ncbi:MAG: endolytic transglycosylase MltG [Chloroflexota bacterium]